MEAVANGALMPRRILLIAAVIVVLFVVIGWIALGPGLFVQNVLSAFSMGSQYALIAIGYSMVYGIVRSDQLCPRRRVHAWGVSRSLLDPLL